MSNPIHLPGGVLLSFVALLLVAAQPAAACKIGEHDFRYVGDTDPNSPTYDSQCTDNDIQAAIDNSTCATTISITGEHSYTAQHLTIQGKSLTLVGVGEGGKCNPPPQVCGNPPCIVPPTTAPLIKIDGTGHTGDSVITITGNSHVTLQYLQITGGQAGSTAHGGGVYFDGLGTLNLDVDTINANNAGYGAGVYVKGDGGDAELDVNDYTLIEGNTAQVSGGGIMAEGGARVFVMGNPAFIGINHAPNGYGGGMYIVGPARADIGSPGYVNLGVIYDNDAAYGAGIAVVGTDNNSAAARLFTTDPEHAVLVQNNRASVEGGALYFHPVAGDYANAFACVFDARIDGNSAPEGAAAYLDYDSPILGSNQGSYLYFNPDALNNDTAFTTTHIPCGPESAASLGAVACAADAPCNEVSANLAVNNASQSSGSIIYNGNSSIAYFYQMKLRNNQAVHAFNSGASGALTLQTCLVADNQFAQQAILATGGTPVIVSNCTMANDIIDATHVIKIDSASTLTMLDDIVDEAGTLTVDQPGNTVGNPNFSVDYVLSNDITTLPGSSHMMQADPLFVDVANGNYHLQAYTQNGVVTASPAIDFAPPVTGDDRDVEGLPFDQDVPQVANRFGIRDLGAYEMQPIADRIFADGFGDPTSLVY